MGPVLSIAPGVLSTEVDGELMLMSVEKGTYFSTNSVGRRIWELLADSVPTAEICRKLHIEAGVELDECRPAIDRFLDELKQAGLIASTMP